MIEAQSSNQTKLYIKMKQNMHFNRKLTPWECYRSELGKLVTITSHINCGLSLASRE